MHSVLLKQGFDNNKKKEYTMTTTNITAPKEYGPDYEKWHKKYMRKDLHSTEFYPTKIRELLQKSCLIAKNWRNEDASEVRYSVYGCRNMATVPAGIKSQCWRTEEKIQSLLRAESHNSAIVRQSIDLFQRYLRTRWK